ncbi:hypothetical protein SEA_YARA_83 [Streptomyces phage Yara]|nr:hypothetical protein SEA_YARA_83 [Streptomyces phage Yara]
MPDIPRGHHITHEAAGPIEAEPEVQAETRGHSPSDQIQPPDADSVDLYGEA